MLLIIVVVIVGSIIPKRHTASRSAMFRELGVKDAQRTWRYRMPTSVAQEIRDGGVSPKILKAARPGLEMVHVFVVSRADLSKVLHDVRELLEPNGVIWVSWPKKAAKVPTDVSEDVVRAEALREKKRDRRQHLCLR